MIPSPRSASSGITREMERVGIRLRWRGSGKNANWPKRPVLAPLSLETRDQAGTTAFRALAAFAKSPGRQAVRCRLPCRSAWACFSS